MRNYKRDALNRLSYKRRSLAVCSVSHKRMLLQNGFGHFLDNVVNCIESNQALLDDILALEEDRFQDVTMETDAKTFSMDFCRLNEVFVQLAGVEFRWRGKRFAWQGSHQAGDWVGNAALDPLPPPFVPGDARGAVDAEG